MPQHTKSFEFALGDKVIVREIGRPGVVDLIQCSPLGIEYRVAFWDSSERKTAWVYGDEIELRKPS